MDTAAAIKMVPRCEDSDETWLAWANEWATLRASNLACTRISAASADFVLEETSFPLNPNGAVNGGMVSLAVDQVMGVLAIRTASTGTHPVTAVLQVHFHRPAYPPLTFGARLIPGGRNIRTVEVVVHDRDGRHCVTGTGTMASRSHADRRPEGDGAGE